VAEVLARRADEMLAYMVEIDREIGNELRLNMVTLINLQRMMRQYNLEELAQKYENMVKPPLYLFGFELSCLIKHRTEH
jgi:hypothetical protein